ncbi:polysaccharide pyruvyl transferase family protein [Planctomicrobium sp. SH527]|uniref:polysaccharide pyruvyl transferase family protein n=1 Tax=Planctomicrobium sp. SH527 TaxID=3448123 RepID=UPI003F5CA5CA
MLSRRDLLKAGAAFTVTAAAAETLLKHVQAEAGSAPRILLRSSWQVVNIGDIAHTPGVLALIEKHLPEAEVILWASGDLTDEVAEMEHRRFPRLKIVKGRIDENGKPSNPELDEAIGWADFLLHGSGPSFVAANDTRSFVKHTGKPFGVYGITFDNGSKEVIELLSSARFVFFRDSVSLKRAKELGVTSPKMEFAPDGAFACDLRNDVAADAFLSTHDLQPGKFLCCIPRLRYTPYWLIRKNTSINEDRARRNEEMREHDHKPLRDAISAVVRQTGTKVLLCPEDMTQVAIGKDNIYDKLPADVQKQVVWRDKFWLTDEALSTYSRSLGLFGLEMHSPIMCIGNGIPALVGRFSEQTSKGFMWRDIGLGDWLFDFDNPSDLEKLTPAVLKLVTDRQATLKTTLAAKARVETFQKDTMAYVKSQIKAGK